MKKLSLIAGLACLATVGGVFGAWTFGTANNEASANQAVVMVATDNEVITLGGATAAIASTPSISYAQDRTTQTKADATVTGALTVTCGHTTQGIDYVYTVSGTATVVAVDEGKSLLEYSLTAEPITLTFDVTGTTATLTTDLSAVFDVASIGTAGNHAANQAMVRSFNEAAANTKVVFSVIVTAAPAPIES